MNKFLVLLLLMALSSCDYSSNGKIKDPGAAGMKTIEGIDKDNDGVRDDLQVWIESSFSDDQSVFEAVRELAKVHPSHCDFKYKSRCLESLVGFDESFEIEMELMERVLNTPERQKDFEARLAPCPLLDEMAAVKCTSKN
jgi:hypothetical protein